MQLREHYIETAQGVAYIANTCGMGGTLVYAVHKNYGVPVISVRVILIKQDTTFISHTLYKLYKWFEIKSFCASGYHQLSWERHSWESLWHTHTDKCRQSMNLDFEFEWGESWELVMAPCGGVEFLKGCWKVWWNMNVSMKLCQKPPVSQVPIPTHTWQGFAVLPFINNKVIMKELACFRKASAVKLFSFLSFKISAVKHVLPFCREVLSFLT